MLSTTACVIVKMTFPEKETWFANVCSVLTVAERRDGWSQIPPVFWCAVHTFSAHSALWQ